MRPPPRSTPMYEGPLHNVKIQREITGICECCCDRDWCPYYPLACCFPFVMSAYNFADFKERGGTTICDGLPCVGNTMNFIKNDNYNAACLSMGSFYLCAWGLMGAVPYIPAEQQVVSYFLSVPSFLLLGLRTALRSRERAKYYGPGNAKGCRICRDCCEVAFCESCAIYEEKKWISKMDKLLPSDLSAPKFHSKIVTRNSMYSRL